MVLNRAGCNDFTAASGKSVSVVVSNGVEQSVEVSGDGVLVKSGSGKLLLEVNKDTPLFNGSVRIDAGRFVPYLPTPLEVFGGTKVAADPDAFDLASIGDSGRIVKSGGAELVLREVPADITSILVEEGILQFSQPLKTTQWPTNTTGYIPSHSFEFGAYKNYGDGTVYGGWTAAINTNNIHAQVFVHSQNQPWHAPFPAPDGNYALALKADVSVETTMTLPVDGVYVLSFLASGRSSLDGHEFDIIIDGKRVATVQTWATEYVPYRYRLPWLEAGSHTLRLQHISTADKLSNLDNFHVDLLSMDKPLDVMESASFECAEFSAGAMEINAPTNAGWTFTANGNDKAMIAAVGSDYCLVPDYGRRVLMLKNQGVASTTMTFPESGSYQLSFKIAHCRTRYSDESQNSHSVTVTVNGSNVGTLSTTSQIYDNQLSSVFSAEAGVPLTLTLTGATTDNRVLLIDDIIAQKVEEGNLISNGGFESGSTGWDLIFDQTYIPKMSAAVLDYSSSTPFYGYNFFEGVRRLHLTQTGAAKQTISFSEPGTYRLTFHAVSRMHVGNADFLGKNPVVAWVSKGGVTNNIGYIKSYDEFFRRHEFYFAIPEAGSYDIGLQGQDAVPTGDRNTLIDSVSVEKVELAELGAILPKSTVLEIAAGAKLNLNFIGTIGADTVRYNGKTLIGTISHETYPEFIYGSGKIYSNPKGTLLLLL